MSDINSKDDSKTRQAKKPVTMNHRPPAKAKFTGDCEDLAECIFGCEDSKQSGNFEGTIDHLANYVGSKYEHGGEIRNLIENLTPFFLVQPTDLPTTPAPTPTETKIWELKITAYVKKDQKIEDNVRKVYSLIWGQCTDFMKSKLETIPNFQAISDSQDVLELLKEMKGFIYKFDNENYTAQSLVEAMDKLHHLYQGKYMTNSQFLEQFKSMVAVIEHYGGSVGKNPKMEQQELVEITNAEYDPITVYSAVVKKAAEKAAKERALACMFLNRAYQIKYLDMVTDLHNDYVKGNDSYPATLKDAYALLTNWRPKFESKPIVAQYGTSFAEQSPVVVWYVGDVVKKESG
jgi:hypothetical protein